MKKYQNYRSFKIRRTMFRKDSELNQMVKVLNKTWNFSFSNESDKSYSVNQEISQKNVEFFFIQQYWLKSKFYHRA